MANQVQNQPTAAYWLSMIGGIIGLLAGLAMLALGAISYMAIGEYLDYYGGYGYSGYDLGLGWAYTLYLGLGIWSFITSILIIVFARKLKANPMESKKWGILILIFSIIGVGGLLGLIGGILALVYKPIPAGQTQQYAAPPPQQPYYGPPPQQAYQAPPQARVCPQCGTQMQANVRFCPSCGRQQY